MARGDFLCPICNQVLGLPTVAVLPHTNIATDSVIGGHIHVTISGDFSCSNGHKFKASGDILLERVP